jgi:hypothetical protein
MGSDPFYDILDLSLKRSIFNRRPTNKDLYMDVNDKKIREARSLPGGVHIFETRMTIQNDMHGRINVAVAGAKELPKT